MGQLTDVEKILQVALKKLSYELNIIRQIRL